MMNSEITIQQLGGFGKLKAMINARNFAAGKNHLQFQFSGNRSMNAVRIELTALDEYKLTFYAFGRKRICTRATATAHCGNIKQVFEQETGLYLSL